MENILGGNIVDTFSNKSSEEFVFETTKLTASYVGYALFHTIETYLLSRVMTIVGHSIKLKLFSALISERSQSFHDKSQTGDLGSRLSTDCDTISTTLGTIIPVATSEIFELLFGTWFMLTTSYKLFFAIAAVMPVWAIASYIQSTWEEPLQEQVRDVDGVMSAAALETLAQVKTVSIFGQQKRERKNFARQLAVLARLNLKLTIVSSISNALLSFSYHICIALTFWYGGRLVLAGDISAGKFLAFCLFAMSLTSSVSYIPQLVSEITSIKVSSARVYAVIDGESEIEDEGENKDETKKKEIENKQKFKKNKEKFKKNNEEINLLSKNIQKKSYINIPESHVVKGHIKFERVSFSYPTRPEVTVLNEFDLEISPGQSAALVGSSGGGKSTIVSLLTRLYDIDGGRITIDGLDISKVDPNWLRKQIGLVSQEPVLFSGTVRDNICYGLVSDDGKNEDGTDDEDDPISLMQKILLEFEAERKKDSMTSEKCEKTIENDPKTIIMRMRGRYNSREVSQERLEKVARMANCHDFIVELPEGYDTLVGERGSMLSGGQKQRIAIARALLRDPKILITDEATSALDNASERVVQQALDRLMHGRTCIVIAHRLSTIKSCNPIFYMSGGQVFENGSHEAMMSIPGGHYAKLYTVEEQRSHLHETEASLKQEEEQELRKSQSEIMSSKLETSEKDSSSNPLETDHKARERKSTDQNETSRYVLE